MTVLGSVKFTVAILLVPDLPLVLCGDETRLNGIIWYFI
uniref:Uncharacterized protein n=1 Tax=Anguilla anguilla TaxID=7936 RepID=A0A0E9V188_ANGAN